MKNIKSQLLVVASLIVMAMGLALVIRANMGCVPLLCPVYVLGGINGQSLTFGILVFLMHLTFTLIQLILQRSSFKMANLLQIPYSLLFGLFIDSSLWLFTPLQWDDSAMGIAARIIQIVAGSAIAGIGYSLNMRTKCRLAGDSLVEAFSQALEFGYINTIIIFDITSVIVGLIFCIFYFGTMRWDMIGAGTLISTGVIAITAKYAGTYLSEKLNMAPSIKNRENDISPYNLQGDTFPLVVTIARTHGSGGHEIGLKVAERLGIKFYDKEIISATAEKLGLSQEDVIDSDQTYSIRHSGRNSSIFTTQSQIICEAAKESCVIIGRCADYVLRDRPYCLNIFVRSDEDYAVTMIRNKDNLSETQAREVIRLKNNAREKHYNHYTGEKWKDPLHYDLVINTAKIGIESAVDIVCNAVENIRKEEEIIIDD